MPPSQARLLAGLGVAAALDKNRRSQNKRSRSAMSSSRPFLARSRAGLAIALAIAASAAVADTHYTSRVVEEPYDPVRVANLSHSGVMLGEIQLAGTNPAILASYLQGPNGKSRQFRPFGVPASYASQLSSAGDLMGVIEDGFGQPIAGYLRRSSGEMARIDARAGGRTNVLGVNAAGVVVGMATNKHNVSTAYSWKDGVFTFYPSTFGGTQSQMRDINDAGIMVGNAEYAPFASLATVWTPDGQATQLANLPGAVTSSAQMISPGGLIVGICEFPGVLYHICSWQDAGAAPVDLGVPPGSGDAGGLPSDVNASGTIVGETDPATLGLGHAVVWKDGQAIDLQTVTTLPAGLALTLVSADAIADDGTILVFAFNSSLQAYKLLLTPHD
jgi:probable HAF family extracellular repeat protein